MNGPEHYRSAEALLAQASNGDVEVNLGNALIAAAHVHATLALISATVDHASLTTVAWREATS